MKARKRIEWRFGSRRMASGDRTLLAGMLEIAPERQASRDPMDADRAFAKAVEMEEAGADLLLIQPDAWMAGVKRAAEAEEVRRLVPVLKRLREKLAIPIGVVTDRASAAERAFDLGAEFILDPTGLTQDPVLAKLIAQRDGGLITGHSRGNPEVWQKLPTWQEPLPALLADLDASLNRARRGGVKQESLMADPGLGFGKRKEQNLEIIGGLSQLERLSVPLSIAVADLHDSAPAVASLLGAHLIRATDVPAARAALDLADAIQLSATLRQERADSEDNNASRVARPAIAEPASRTLGKEGPPFRKPGDRPGNGPPGREGPQSPKSWNRPPRPPR